MQRKSIDAPRAKQTVFLRPSLKSPFDIAALRPTDGGQGAPHASVVPSSTTKVSPIMVDPGVASAGSGTEGCTLAKDADMPSLRHSHHALVFVCVAIVSGGYVAAFSAVAGCASDPESIHAELPNRDAIHVPAPGNAPTRSSARVDAIRPHWVTYSSSDDGRSASVSRPTDLTLSRRLSGVHSDVHRSHPRA